MLLHLWSNNSSIPSSIPPGAELGAALEYPNTPPAFPTMPSQGSAFPWLGSIPVHTQGIPPDSTAQPGKSPSWWQIPLKFPLRAVGPEPGNTESCPCSSGENLGSAGMKEPLWSPRGCSLSSLQLCAHFSWEGSEIPAPGLAPPCQNSSDLCNHTRFSGYLISAVMRLWKPPPAKCFLLL